MSKRIHTEAAKRAAKKAAPSRPANHNPEPEPKTDPCVGAEEQPTVCPHDGSKQITPALADILNSLNRRDDTDSFEHNFNPESSISHLQFLDNLESDMDSEFKATVERANELQAEVNRLHDSATTLGTKICLVQDRKTSVKKELTVLLSL